MLAIIKLEAIGDDYFAYQRSKEKTICKSRKSWEIAKREGSCWVARIAGHDPKYHFAREFVKGQRDYAQANSVGSRGIFVYYALKSGIYEVNDRITWGKTRRYFIRVEGTEYKEITREEVEQWLKSDLASTS